MDTLMLKILPEKKDFFLALLKEFSFVTVETTFGQAEEDVYIKAILESEENIVKGEVLPHHTMEQQIQSWRKRTT